jgi:hypothetical protein
VHETVFDVSYYEIYSHVYFRRGLNVATRSGILVTYDIMLYNFFVKFTCFM